MEETLGPLGSFVERFSPELVQERFDNRRIDAASMSFAAMEMRSHQIGRRVAQPVGHEMTDRHGELDSHDDCCPKRGLECEAIKHRARSRK